MDDIVFWIAFVVSLGSAVGVVSQRNPVYCAVALLVCFLSFGVVYLTLHAPFIAAIHVIVYAGAILVLFLFVIMLLNLRGEELGREYPVAVKGLVGLLCVAGAGGVVAVLVLTKSFPMKMAPLPAGQEESFGGVEAVGRELFGGYLVHFELIAVLLLVAMIGTMVLAKKKA